MSEANMEEEPKDLGEWWAQIATPDETIRDAGETAGKHYLACILVRPVTEDSAAVHVAYNPNLDDPGSSEVRDKLALECMARVNSFLNGERESGPYLWQLRSDGDYQVWMTGYDLPEF